MANELTILDLVHEGLQAVEQTMLDMSETAFGPLGAAFQHLIGGGGKRLRPALALAAYRVCGGERVDPRAVSLAAAVETLHSATLVHDDLIDESALRRGRTTLNTMWSKGATVLAGDYMFARAAGFAADTGNVRVVQLFADTLRVICDGELRQLFSSRDWQQPKDAYYTRIFAKTASLFASATQSGAILAGASDEVEQGLRDYGYHLGMAFQIVDDILDFTGDETVLGKPVGSDLRQGTVTLPFFYFLQEHPYPQAVIDRLERGDGNGDAVTDIVAAVRGSNAIQQARAEAQSFAKQARQDLEVLRAGPYQAALADLADFVTAREL